MVQSPSQSLEWHVWWSSSGNNCHAVHWSLSSGASVYECTMGFYLVPFFQPSPPTRFLLITAIGLCHFLPVHHFGMACLAGSKVNIQHLRVFHTSFSWWSERQHVCWCLSASKSTQVPRTLLSILTDLDNAVVWMVLVSNSGSPFTKPFEIIPSALITVGITITFMFQIFFNFLARFEYLFLFSFSLIFFLWSAGTAKFTIRQILFFLDYH